MRQLHIRCVNIAQNKLPPKLHIFKTTDDVKLEGVNTLAC